MAKKIKKLKSHSKIKIVPPNLRTEVKKQLSLMWEFERKGSKM